MPSALCARLAFCSAFAASLSAQQLVRDLDPAPTQPFSTIARQLTGDGQRVFFTAATNECGEALYATDGTAAGTRLFKDLPAGALSDLPRPLGMLGSELVFTVTSEIWITDNTPTRATFLSDRVQTGFSGFTSIGQVGARFLFADRGSIGTTHLWASDGTAAGTVSLASLYLNRSVVAGGRAFFSASQGTLGFEPWVSDGTPAGTRLIADLVPGGSSAPTGFASLGGVVHFLAALSSGDLALWRSDGTAAGTVMIQAFPGVRLNGANAEMIEHNGRLLFRLGNDLCSSDGTPTGLQVVAANLPELADLRSVGGTCYFTARTAASGRELYASDGTIPGTRILVELSPGAADTGFAAFAEVQGRLFARTVAQGNWGVLATDGTAAGTSVVAAPGPGALFVAEMAAVGSGVVINVANGLFASDGTAAGTALLATPGSWRPGTFARPGVALGEQLLFFADDGSSGRELWRTDGTAAGTTQVVDLFAGAGDGIQADAEIAAMDGFVYFTTGTVTVTNQAFRPRLLYRTDGTAAGTVALTQFGQPNSGGYAYGLQVDDHALYFADSTPAGNRLFRTDGSSIQQVTNVAMSGGSPYLVVGGLVYYFADSYRLWRSDGTAGGTFELASQTYGLLGELGGRMVFVDGGAIKITDGTLAGTAVLTTLGSPWSVSSVGSFAGALYWLQPRASNPYMSDLLRTDGTAAGTAVVSSFARQPRQAVIAADAIYLLAFDAAGGTELWRCDGTAAGTQQVVDLAPGRESGVQDLALIGAGNRLFLAATDGVTGLEPWISDGTASGTVQLLDGNPLGSGNPQYLGSAGSRCYFLLDDGVHGVEPWQAPLALVGAASVQPLGRGCAGAAGVPELTANSAPRVDAPGFALALRHLPAASFAVFALGSDRVPMTLPSGCMLWPSGMVVLRFLLTGLDGSAALPLPIPPVPALVGVELTAQAGGLDAFGMALPGLSSSNALLLVVGG